MGARYVVGDVFDVMKSMPDQSVDLILTSPPFLALRSYLPADHPAKGKEIGSESTPAEFIDVLLRLTAEWRRLLTPHGSLVVELGDTYSSIGGFTKDGRRKMKGSERDALHVGREGIQSSEFGRPFPGGPGWPLPKSLTLIPEAYRFGLAYGINPHTGAESPAGRWRVRNVIRWVRPNPPVGALGDKFRPATSELVVATVAKDRWFDLDAVREPHAPHTVKYDGGTRPHYGERGGQGTVVEMEPGGKSNPAGAPPLDWWKISPTGYAGAHYAVWPPELCVKPIKAMCPERVCRVCGEPSRRVVDISYESLRDGSVIPVDDGWRNGRGGLVGGLSRGKTPDRSVVETVGWSDCGHDDWRPGVVLDPFAGTGTTLAVATGLGRDAIGIDIDERNADLAVERVGGLFMTVEST